MSAGTISLGHYVRIVVTFATAMPSANYTPLTGLYFGPVTPPYTHYQNVFPVQGERLTTSCAFAVLTGTDADHVDEVGGTFDFVII